MRDGFTVTAPAVVGPISFMGLIVANLSRQLLRTYRHTQLVAGSVLFGMVILVAGQLLVEVSLKKQQLRGVSFLCQHKKTSLRSLFFL